MLTNLQVQQLRVIYNLDADATMGNMGVLFGGITVGCVSDILHGRTYQAAGGPLVTAASRKPKHIGKRVGLKMARLPGERFLIQQIGGEVVLFEEGTEREIVRFDPHGSGGADASAKAQGVINSSTEMNGEEKAFAHFWSGYFYAYACMEGARI
jgi:hypothetical protein